MLTVKLTLERLSKDGRLLARRELPSRSFLKALLQQLQSVHDYLTVTIQDTNDAAKPNTATNNGNMKVSSGGGHAAVGFNSSTDGLILAELIGIQVGTGTTAPTPTDYAMETRIAHGQGGGEFEYGGCELLALTFADPNGEFTIRRYFTNVSGGEITVNEIGIYSLISGGNAYAACIARDKVAPGVAVANTEILRVTYVPQITV